MKIDYSKIECAAEYDFDYCVIGAGVAGVITAREIKKKYPESKVCIVESGGDSLNTQHNKLLKDVAFSDLPIKRASREFAIGGATNTWGGLTSHFERFEIEERNYLEISKWPIEYEQLVHYYKKVSDEYNFIFTVDKKCESENFTSFTRRAFFAYIDAINYKDYLTKDIDLIFNACVTSLISNDRLIKKAIISNAENDIKSSIRANRFILAAGGLENIKLLLNSVKRNDLILGEEKKFLGRYFMNHPKNEFGVLKLNKHTDLSKYIGQTDGNVLSYFGVSLDVNTQKSKELLNNYVRFEPSMPWNKDKCVYSFIQLVKKSKYFMKAFLSLRKSSGTSMLDYGETGDEDYENELVTNDLITSIRNLSLYLFFRATNKSPKTKEYNVRNYIEMEPRFQNKVTLTDTKDAVGQYNICVDYSVSEREKRSTITLHSKIDEMLKSESNGGLDSSLESVETWPIHTDASHHCGGTVMGFTPDDSFVDSNLKVHSIDNLFIASSSVMPTSGSQNPTFTIAALSYMLVDRLN